MTLRMFCAGAIVLSTATAPVHAQVQFPVAAPEPKVGEVAKYRTIDLWNNKELSTSVSEIVEVQSDRLVTRTKRADQASPTTVTFTREWQPCRAMQNSDKTVCTGSFKFPMQVGAKHRYESLPWANGLGHSSAECEVKGHESVTVAGGTFDSVRIDCSGFYTRTIGGSWSGKLVEAYWYAPKIHRVVKSQYTDYNAAGGSIFNKTQTELTEFVGK